MGVHQTTISRWKDGTKPRDDKVRIAADLMGLHTERINEMLLDSVLDSDVPEILKKLLDLQSTESLISNQNNGNKSDRVESVGPFSGPVWKVPVLGRVPGGDAVPLDECFDGVIEVPAAMLSGAKAKEQDLFALRIYGDSMDPTIPGGSLLFVDRRYSDFTRFRPGTIVVANLNGEVTCKELIVEESRSGKRIVLKPHNPQFRTITIIQEDYFRILGRVAAHIAFHPNGW